MARTDSKEAALELLNRIKAYWLDRGFKVEGTIKNAGYSDRLRSTVFEVETNIISGIPSHRKDAA
ncbi:MAG: hypothetical protein AAFZ74_00865 [Pseudomonadota bacterium]